MTELDELFSSVDGTREEIMQATYLALCEHGYPGLTIDHIAEEFPKSKSLIYHHYDGKDELLLGFLEYILEYFEEDMPLAEDRSASEQLNDFLDHVFLSPLPAERHEFSKAMVEVRSQAAHDERFRAHFTRTDDLFIDRLRSIIETGIERGEFDSVAADPLASFIHTVFVGSMTRQVTDGGYDAATIRDQLASVLDRRLRGGP